MVNFIYWSKCKGRMTIFAVVGSQHMIGIFRGSDNTVMTDLAVTGNPFVIKYRIMPGICAMAVITDVATLYMPWMLTYCNNPIMTGLTLTRDGEVINSDYIFPVSGLMTKLAIVCSSHMFR